MTSSLSTAALLLFATTSLFAAEESVDTAGFNERIAAATATGEDWARDPSRIAAVLVGPWLSPEGEMASQRREILASTSGEDPSTGIHVLVKEDGLFDDATNRIDHHFQFTLINEVWTITEASVKYHDARPPFPIRETENIPKAAAGKLLLQQESSPALAALAATGGINDLTAVTSRAMEGDGDSLNAILNLSLLLTDATRTDYATLLYGLSCYFEKPGFTRYLFFNLNEGAPAVIFELIREIESQ